MRLMPLKLLGDGPPPGAVEEVAAGGDVVVLVAELVRALDTVVDTEDNTDDAIADEVPVADAVVELILLVKPRRKSLTSTRVV